MTSVRAATEQYGGAQRRCARRSAELNVAEGLVAIGERAAQLAGERAGHLDEPAVVLEHLAAENSDVFTAGDLKRADEHGRGLLRGLKLRRTVFGDEHDEPPDVHGWTMCAPRTQRTTLS